MHDLVNVIRTFKYEGLTYTSTIHLYKLQIIKVLNYTRESLPVVDRCQRF